MQPRNATRRAKPRAPFQKSRRGHQRRVERKFIREVKLARPLAYERLIQW